MHHRHRLRLRGQFAFRIFKIKTSGLRINVYEHRHTTEKPHRKARCEERVGRHKDFAASRQIECEIHAGQRARAVDVISHKGRTGVSLPFLFKRRQFGVKIIIVDEIGNRLLLGLSVAGPANQLLYFCTGQRHGLRTAGQRKRFGL